jgi:hypothetical protein
MTLLLLGIFIGALMDRLMIWSKRAWDSKQLALALREEISPIGFDTGSGRFGAFFTIVYDAHVPLTLPPNLAERVMRFYQGMKYVRDDLGGQNTNLVPRLKTAHEELLKRLDRHAKRSEISIIWNWRRKSPDKSPDS